MVTTTTTDSSGKKTITITRRKSAVQRIKFKDARTGRSFTTKRGQSVQQALKEVREGDKQQALEKGKETRVSEQRVPLKSVSTQTSINSLEARTTPLQERIEERQSLVVPSRADTFFSSIKRQVQEGPPQTISERRRLAQVERLTPQVKSVEEKAKEVQKREERFLEGGFLRQMAESTPRSVDKGLLQVQARIFGTKEQREEAKFFKEGSQTEAFFRAVSPLVLKDVTAPKLEVLDKASIGVIPELRTKATRQVVGQKIGLNPEGLVNIAFAAAFAGVTAAPILARPSSPFSGIRGNINIGVEAFTEKGITKSITELQFNRRSPTLSGLLGKKAQTTVKSISPGEGLKVTTKVGKKEFVFDQPLVSGNPILTQFKSGQLVSKKVIKGRTSIGSRTVEGVVKTELTEPVVVGIGDVITTIQTGRGAAPITLQTGRFQRFGGKIDFETIVKQTIDVTKQDTPSLLTQVTSGQGVLKPKPVVKITPPAPVGIGGVSPGRVEFNFGSTFDPATGGLSGGGLRKVTKPSVRSSLPKTAETTPFEISLPVPTKPSFSLVPPIVSSPQLLKSGLQPIASPQVTPVNQFDSLFRSVGDAQPIPDGIIGSEPLVGSEPITDFPAISDVLSPSITAFDEGIVGKGITPPTIPSGQFIEGPIVPFAIPELPSFGGGSQAFGVSGRKRKGKKKKTKTIFQSIFGTPEGLQGIRQGGPKTGLTLRF